MTGATLALMACLLAAPPAQQAGTALPFAMDLPTAAAPTAPHSAPVDLRAAVKSTVAAMALEDRRQARDPETGQFVAGETERGYFGMLQDGITNPAELAWMAASVADIWSRAEVTRLCEEAETVSCGKTALSAQVDTLLTGGVYMGVTGLERLAKKYWDVDLDDGWKNVLLWGGMSAVRVAATWIQVSLANDIRNLPPGR